MEKKNTMVRWLAIIGLLLLITACSLQPSQDNDQAILEQALAENNPALCSEITREHWITWCYSDIAANTQDKQVCDYLEGSFKENCIKTIALSTQDIELCQEIRGTGAGDACYNNFAREALNATICSDIESLRMKNDCFVFLARENKDYNTCLLVEEDQGLKENCLFRATLIEETNEGCALIESRALRDACYITYAANFGSPDDCDDVSTGQQGACEQAVNQ